MADIVAFGGRAGAGKTTAARYLRDIVQPERAEHVEFSDPIVDLAQQWLDGIEISGMDRWQVLDGILADTVSIEYTPLINVGETDVQLANYFATINNPNIRESKPEHRTLLEWLGKAMVTHIDVSFWSNQARQKAIDYIKDGCGLVTVSGVRLKSDAEVMRQAGWVVRVVRGNEQVLLPTETELGDWAADYIVLNNGSIDELYMSVKSMWNALANSGIHRTG